MLLKLGAVRGELVIDGRVFRHRLREVDDLKKKVYAFEVREEFVTEPDSLARTLDQSRHVGNGLVGGFHREQHPRIGASVVGTDSRQPPRLRIQYARRGLFDLPALGSGRALHRQAA